MTQQSQFLDLPREIRDEIYWYALCPFDIPHMIFPDRRVLQIGDTRPSQRHSPPKRRYCMVPGSGLITTSKQVHREAMETFYRDTHFYFMEHHAAVRFLEAITPENAARLRYMIIRYEIIGQTEPFWEVESEGQMACLQRLRDVIVRSCAGLRTLDIVSIEAYPLLDVDYYWQSVLTGLAELDISIVRQLPALEHRLVHMQDRVGHVRSEHDVDMLPLVKELGWPVCRRVVEPFYFMDIPDSDMEYWSDEIYDDEEEPGKREQTITRPVGDEVLVATAAGLTLHDSQALLQERVKDLASHMRSCNHRLAV